MVFIEFYLQKNRKGKSIPFIFRLFFDSEFFLLPILGESGDEYDLGWITPIQVPKQLC